MLRDTDPFTPHSTEGSPKSSANSTPLFKENSAKRGLSKWADPTVGSKTAFMDCILELQTGGRTSPSQPQPQPQPHSPSQLSSSVPSSQHHTKTTKKSSPRHASSSTHSPPGKSAALIMEDSEKSGDDMLRLNIQSKIASLLDSRYWLVGWLVDWLFICVVVCV